MFGFLFICWAASAWIFPSHCIALVFWVCSDPIGEHETEYVRNKARCRVLHSSLSGNGNGDVWTVY